MREKKFTESFGSPKIILDEKERKSRQERNAYLQRARISSRRRRTAKQGAKRFVCRRVASSASIYSSGTRVSRRDWPEFIWALWRARLSRDNWTIDSVDRLYASTACSWLFIRTWYQLVWVTWLCYLRLPVETSPGYASGPENSCVRHGQWRHRDLVGPHGFSCIFSTIYSSFAYAVMHYTIVYCTRLQMKMFSKLINWKLYIELYIMKYIYFFLLYFFYLMNYIVFEMMPAVIWCNWLFLLFYIEWRVYYINCL